MASASPLDKIACRAIIINKGKLLIVKLKPEHDFYCLPWGSLERRETVEQCFEREIYEELWVKPIVWELLFINQWLLHQWDKHILEFFYSINNSSDFLSLDHTKASHGFEVHEVKWVDINEDITDFAPKELLPHLKTLDENNLENHKVKVIISE